MINNLYLLFKSAFETASLGFKISDRVKLFAFALASSGLCRREAKFYWITRLLIKDYGVKIVLCPQQTMYLNPSDWGHKQALEEIFLSKSYDFALVKTSPDIVLDCGAHIGMFSKLCCVHFPNARHICYEPSANNYDYLERNLKSINTHIEVHHKAVGVSDGSCSFLENGNSLGGRVVLNDDNNLSVYSKVDLVKLRDVVLSVNPNRLLLKLDIEYGEKEVINDIIDVLPNNSFLFYETHDNGLYRNELAALLEKHEFVVKLTEDKGGCANFCAIRGDFDVN